jgi:hypothetical protein
MMSEPTPFGSQGGSCAHRPGTPPAIWFLALLALV